MNRSEFLDQFDGMAAGFVGWREVGDGVVVSCSVFSSAAHESAWLACHGQTRHDAAKHLRDFGVHRLKFAARPSRAAPEGLVDAAVVSRPLLVALLPNGDIVSFPDP